MKDFFIKYNIEDIINQKLYEEKLIDENTYKIIKDKLLRLLYKNARELQANMLLYKSINCIRFEKGELNDLIRNEK